MPSSSPEEFAAFIRAEMTKWAKVVKDAGIRPE
jgi:tripartite-type tricarboxylate transporter receptor subunit TctC